MELTARTGVGAGASAGARAGAGAGVEEGPAVGGGVWSLDVAEST